MNRTTTLCLGITITCATLSSARADWPNFLGPGGNPVVSTSVPTEFSVADAENDKATKNVAWKVELPGRSVSGPIVVGGKVITTSSGSLEERWMHVAAVDEDTGKLLWRRSTKATGRPFCHPTSANAAPTPCSDGEQIYAFFSSNDIVCYDLDGNLKWFKSLTADHPLAGNDVGMGSSPAVVDGIVVCSVECQADSFLAGLDTSTGATVWEVPRPQKANWATPKVATDGSGKSVIVMHGGDNLIGIEPRSGKVMWEIKERFSPVASAAVVENKIYVPTASGIKVFEVVTAEDKPNVVSESSRLRTGYTSLVSTKHGLLGINRSILICLDEEGDIRWKTRLEDAGQIWASPVVAGDKLYSFAMNGKCFTVGLGGDEAQVLAESELGSEVLGTPAISDGAMFVRSVDALWKIGG
ncbi:MAG TPA: pyrrolo-quinoline quinone [Planctomycetaceae bacterium]|nr:pyrrolo-quinoline quinone [Planctomycetaceae bacterium]